MAVSTINSEKSQADFPGRFNKRECKASESIWKSKIGADSDNVTLTRGDGVNFVTIDGTSGNATLTVPNAAESKNRLVFIRCVDSTNTVLFQEADGTAIVADLAAGQYAYQCDGSSWLRVF